MSMPLIKFIKGKKYGRLALVRELPVRLSSDGTRQRMVECICDCGKKLKCSFAMLRHKKPRSCIGCWYNDKFTHGLTKSTTYTSWRSMIGRCNNPNAANYRLYGKRGITVCKRWLKFENFLEDMGVRPSTDLSLDRINNAGNYEPSNCRWATRSQQQRNKRTRGNARADT